MSLASRSSRSVRRRVRLIIALRRRRNTRWLLALVAVMALVPLIAFGRVLSSVRPARTSSLAARPVPADLFILSIVTDDGALGWQQLCPDLQKEVSKADLIHEAQTQHTALSQHGIALTASYVGTTAQSTSGNVRVYVVTAHWASGETQERVYSVLTRTSGCVADVKSQ